LHCWPLADRPSPPSANAHCGLVRLGRAPHGHRPLLLAAARRPGQGLSGADRNAGLPLLPAGRNYDRQLGAAHRDVPTARARTGRWAGFPLQVTTAIKDISYSGSPNCSWTNNCATNLLFPLAIQGLGYPATFVLIACLCCATGTFALLCVPETRGKSLEQLELEFRQQSSADGGGETAAAAMEEEEAKKGSANNTKTMMIRF
jgi:hypothetical protein